MNVKHKQQYNFHTNLTLRRDRENLTLKLILKQIKPILWRLKMKIHLITPHRLKQTTMILRIVRRIVHQKRNKQRKKSEFLHMLCNQSMLLVSPMLAQQVSF